ncbi:MAG: FKBP-type peptidyl-prolyl cis-trans isomerase, partial [Pseudomonadota bacterium]
MIRNLLLSMALGLTLTACSQADAPEIDPSDPFATLAPWDTDRSDIVTTDSGLQYYVLASGDAAEPTLQRTDTVVAEYDMRFESDGARWDSSEERNGFAAIFRVPDRLPGWTEALQLMRPGDEWMIYTPASLAFGEEGGAGVPAGTGFVTRMKVIDVKSGDYPGDGPWEEHTPWNSDAESVLKTESGLEYIVLKSGPESGQRPGVNDTAIAHYEGRLAETGETFDNSFDRGTPGEFRLSGVIPGWTEIVPMMKPGDEWLVYIPSNLAYGARPRPGIPADSDLIFRIDLFGAKPDEYPGNDIWETYTPWDPEADGIQTTEKGSTYIELESGAESDNKPKPGDTVLVNYDGRLASNGARFDGNFEDANPLALKVGGVIEAWNEVLQL